MPKSENLLVVWIILRNFAEKLINMNRILLLTLSLITLLPAWEADEDRQIQGDRDQRCARSFLPLRLHGAQAPERNPLTG